MSLSTGQIIGIVVGVLISLFFIGFLLFYFINKKNHSFYFSRSLHNERNNSIEDDYKKQSQITELLEELSIDKNNDEVLEKIKKINESIDSEEIWKSTSDSIITHIKNLEISSQT